MATTEERRKFPWDHGLYRFHDGPIPTDFDDTPLTVHEITTWAGMTAGERALFRGYLSSQFRWVLDREGDSFQVWLDMAVWLGLTGPDVRWP